MCIQRKERVQDYSSVRSTPVSKPFLVKFSVPATLLVSNQREKILDRLGSARIFDKSKFPALYRLEKRSGKFDLSKHRADPSHSNTSLMINAKEIYPCDQGKQHRNSSAQIARIDYLSIKLRQYKNDSILSKKVPILKLPLFFITYVARVKRGNFKFGCFLD